MRQSWLGFEARAHRVNSASLLESQVMGKEEGGVIAYPQNHQGLDCVKTQSLLPGSNAF